MTTPFADNPRIGSELKLAVDCCKCTFREGRGVAPVVAAEFYWELFLRLTRFHRVEGLVWNALSTGDFRLPEAIRAELSDAAVAIAARNLEMAAVSRSLFERFDAAGVPLLFLKGLTLGTLAYANPAAKSAIDIDLLIDPSDLGKAAQLLRECGFRLAAPLDSPDDRVLRAWHRTWKESVWAKDSLSLQLDLHTRASDNRQLIPDIGVHSPKQWVEVGDGVRLPTLATDELFAYLAVHGASSAWFRLKWISDFAALLHDKGGEIERLHLRSQELGAGRAPGQALLLADELFGTLEHAPALRQQLEGDRLTVRLARMASALLKADPVEPTDRRWGTLPIHLTQFLLLPGLGYKASELAWQARRLVSRLAV